MGGKNSYSFSMSKGKVKFLGLDKKLPKIDNIAAAVAQRAIKDEESFDTIAQLLLVCTKVEEIKTIFFERVSSIKKENIHMKNKNIEEILNILKSAYDGISKKEELDLIRGRILEEILNRIYRKTYANSQSIFGTGCQIEIHDTPIEYVQDEDNKKKTVDIAGYNTKIGEFYEAKVGPYKFDALVINFLNLLYDKAKANVISDELCVGCITFDTQVKLIKELKKLEVEEGIKFNLLHIQGKVEIKNKIFSAYAGAI